ncbi:MAG: hypothetical protein JWN76_2521 [Chitinophagaceae bacterium]|nr:hypothetical protein [Chitinophagaceae bacterium]
MPAFHLIIKGKVQGVFFRVSAKEKADELGITGWVKNTDDGNVEAVACGQNSTTEEFITWCRKGPRRAQVTELIVKETDQQSFTGFTIV